MQRSEFFVTGTLPNRWIIVAGKIPLFLVRKMCGMKFTTRRHVCVMTLQAVKFTVVFFSANLILLR